ncbi:MAG: gfo/Idh/MocA family oxidoreductase [Paenibacillus sp.]|jgi:predicted dehydrogenase|nr:gfo/Idh/MocA family oxidoreductase [Paenibacillus sp.]
MMKSEERNRIVKSQLRVGLIGCGAILQRRHLPEYLAHKDVVIVSVCDPNLERAQEVARQFGIPNAYETHQQLLQSGGIDAVSVCTPNHLHSSVSIEAMELGIHVLVEKPMATSLKEAEAMIRTAKEQNVFLMVGHNQRFMPAHRKAKDILQSGKLGKVLSFSTIFGHSGPEHWSIDGKNSWFFNQEHAFSGALGDLGIHKADLIHWLLEDSITEVTAFCSTLHKPTNVDDHSMILLKTASGTVGSLTASWTNYANEINSTTLYCEKGTLKIGTDARFEVIVEYSDGMRDCHEVGALQTNKTGEQHNSGVIRHFVDGILSGNGHEITGVDGYRALQTILSGMESQHLKKVVVIPELVVIN